MRLAAALALEDRTEFRAAAHAYRSCPHRAAAWLSARLELRTGSLRRAMRRLARLDPRDPLVCCTLLLRDARLGLVRGLAARAESAIARLEAAIAKPAAELARPMAGAGARPARELDLSETRREPVGGRPADAATTGHGIPRALLGRAVADATDALWSAGRRERARALARRLRALLGDPETAYRAANYDWALGRRPRIDARGGHLPSLLLAAELDGRRAADLWRRAVLLAPRGELADVAHWRLALRALRMDPPDARAAGEHLRALGAIRPRSPLAGSARALLRSLDRPGPGRRHPLTDFPAALQAHDACVATALALVARWWRHRARLPRRGVARGVPFLEVPAAARRLGLATAPVPLTPAGLVACLARGIPVLLPEEEGEGHLTVAIGYDERWRIVELRDPAFLDPVEEPLSAVARAAWRRGSLGLAAAPPEIALPVFAAAEQKWRALVEAHALRVRGRTDAAIRRATGAGPAARAFAVEALLLAGRHPEALRAARSWAASGPRNRACAQALGDAAWVCGHPCEAEQAYRRALRRAPRDKVVLSRLGAVLLEAGRARAARRALLAACDAEPDDPDLHRQLRQVASALGDRRLAAEEREWERRHRG